jgi:hypothetical protein
MPGSIHTARWVNQITDQGWEIHLFPSSGEDSPHPQLRDAVLQYPFGSRWRERARGFGLFRIADLIDWVRRHFEKRCPHYRALALRNTIRKLRPAVIHSMEIQAAGYLTLEAKEEFHGKFPLWLMTNWGSDIFLFGRLQAHHKKIREVLNQCDYYSCECQRDVDLARTFGFQGEVLPVFPNAGGFDLSALKPLRQNITSKRRLIMLKGYQGWAGRALVGLRALERCADLLDGYEICIYSACHDVALAAELLSEKSGIPTRIIPPKTPHREMLVLHAQARISIGLSISDSISTSLLEAMVMGSFPIQSCTACVDEWVQHGVSGMIVPPEDPEIIERAIRTAMTDDDLVNRAAEINWDVARSRLDDTLLKHKAVEMYRSILAQNCATCRS